ncbi:hypothetical protein DSECCO2_589490 [anaerobic digester metagenome]
MVVAQQRLAAVGIRPDDRKRTGMLFQRKQIIVLQQNQRAAGSLIGEQGMLLTIQAFNAQSVVDGLLVELPQLEAGGHHPHCGLFDLFTGDQALLESFLQALVFTAAGKVASPLQSKSRRLLFVFGDLVVEMKVADCPAVGDVHTFKAPFASELVLHEVSVCTTRLTVEGAVCAHYRIDVCLLHSRLKGRKVGLFQVFLAHNCIKAMPERLRSTVGGKVLDAGGGLENGTTTLQSLDEGHCQALGQIRVLTESFLPASPAGVAKDVDIRRPDGKSLVDVTVAFGFVQVVFCPLFG